MRRLIELWQHRAAVAAWAVLLTTVEILSPSAARAAALSPVSPGSPAGAEIDDVCPTFSWSGGSETAAVDIVVYRIGDRHSEMEVAFKKRLPASTWAWTPSLDRCLERGERYAWSVRATGSRGAGVWATPNLFRIAAAASGAELERVLEIVRLYLTEREMAPAPEEESSVRAAAASGVERGAHRESRGRLAAVTHGAKAGPVRIASDNIWIGSNEVVTTATDGDTLAGLSCSGGQVAKWNPALGAWSCAGDRLDGMVCSSGQILRRFGGAWICETDRLIGYEVIAGPVVTCGPLSSCGATVDCPAGKVVIGGGIANQSSEGVRLISTFPIPSLNRWSVEMRNTTISNNRLFTPYAICATSSGGF